MQDYFDAELAMDELTSAGILVFNTPWWKDNYPEHIKNDTWVVCVNCNDVFSPAADAEEVRYSELEDLYSFFKKSEKYGPIAWCIKKRQQEPWLDRLVVWFEEGPWKIKDLIKEK